LKAKKGVTEAKADFAAKRVEVTFDDKIVAEREIEKTIEQARFSIVKPEPPDNSKR
jgi:copper chaperone CopZ